MQTLKSAEVFPENKMGHITLSHADGDYYVDNDDCIITISDNKLVKVQRFFKNNVPYCVFTFDYDNMKTYRKFPRDGIKAHEFNLDTIKNGGKMYEQFVKVMLNSTMQLEGQVESVAIKSVSTENTTNSNKKMLVATLKNGKHVHWNMDKTDKLNEKLWRTNIKLIFFAALFAICIVVCVMYC